MGNVILAVLLIILGEKQYTCKVQNPQISLILICCRAGTWPICFCYGLRAARSVCFELSYRVMTHDRPNQNFLNPFPHTIRVLDKYEQSQGSHLGFEVRQDLAKSAPLNSGPIAKAPIEQALVEAPLQKIKTKHEKMRENSNRNPNRFRDMLGKNPDCVIEQRRRFCNRVATTRIYPYSVSVYLHLYFSVLFKRGVISLVQTLKQNGRNHQFSNSPLR